MADKGIYGAQGSITYNIFDKGGMVQKMCNFVECRPGTWLVDEVLGSGANNPLADMNRAWQGMANSACTAGSNLFSSNED